MELASGLAKLGFVQNPDQIEYRSHLTNPMEPVVPEIFPTPNNPPWNSISALGVWVASVLFILIIPAIFLLPYLASLDQTAAMPKPSATNGSSAAATPAVDVSRIKEEIAPNGKATELPKLGSDPTAAELMEFAKSDPTAIFLQIAAIIPAHLLTLLLAWVVVTRGRRYSANTTLGLEKGGFAWWHYCIILGGFFVVAAVVGHFFPEQENDLLRILRSSRSAVYIVAFVATVTAPIAEEIVYRGMLYSAFQRALGVPAAFLFVTFLFAVVHVPQYYPSYSTIFLLVLLSLTLTAIRVKTKNLLPCIILHTLFNGIQSVILILEPYMTAPQVQEQTASVLRFFE